MRPSDANLNPNDPGESVDPIDPNEKTNRQFYEFTDRVDRNVLAPVADVYIKYVPNPMQRSIGNFYDNLAYPNVILNDFLQGKIKQGIEDSLRFVVNSTVGAAGLFDVAASMGLPQHDESAPEQAVVGRPDDDLCRVQVQRGAYNDI